jgi:hypothetical protein
MKCMICGGQTLPRSKLCKPCRSALRRARDDTVSELMPLPRRMDALAWQHARSAAGPLTVVDASAESNGGRRAQSLGTILDPAFGQGRKSTLRTAALALIALAVGSLAFVGTQQMRIESESAAAGDASAPPPGVLPTRISPASLVAAARESAVGPAEEPGVETPIVVEPQAAPVRARRDVPRPERLRTPAPSVSPQADAVTAFGPGPVDPPRAAPVAAPVPPVPQAPQLDRWQSLSAALARCIGNDLWKRASCEHAARQQYCDGSWGQNALCPSGIVNDHGQ